MHSDKSADQADPNRRNPLKSIAGLTVLDFGLGMAAALVASQLRFSGAQLIRIEPAGGDPFYDVYPAYAVWREGSKHISAADRAAAVRLADICIIGGEDFPGLAPPPDAAELQALNPKLIILQIKGDIGSGPPCPAVDLLIQARSGHCHEQFSDRPIATAFPAPTYGAVLLGLITIFAALLERHRTGKGIIASTSLRQGAAIWWSADWSSAERPNQRFQAVIPKDVRQLIFKCRDGKYLHFVLGIPGAVAKVFGVLGIDQPVDPNDRGMPDAMNSPANHFFRDSDLLGRFVALQDRQPLLEAFWRVGIAAEAVEEAGAIWDDEQTRINGFIVTDERGWRHVGSPIAIQATDVLNSAAEARAQTALRIIDLGNFLAGPYASRIPADLGIDVIKIEPPGGDPNRYMQRSFASGARGKRSIGIDAKAPEGMAIISRLCATANAVHHNFRPGVAARLGLDPVALRSLRPDMVTLQSSAYGGAGPKALNSGFDMIMQACCGLERHGAGKGNPPLWYRSPLVDYAGGAIGTIALFMGLYEQAVCGGAVEAETSLLGAGLFLMSELVQAPDGRFLGAPELNAEQTGFHPAEQIYRTSDGWVAVAARSDEMAARFADCLGFAELLGLRRAWNEETGRQIAAVIRPMSSEALLEILAAAGVWAEPCVNDGWRAATKDPVLYEQGLIGALDDADVGRVVFVNKLVDPILELGACDRAAMVPELGEHTTEILLELGISNHEIEDLYARRIVF